MPWTGTGTYNLPPAYSPEINGTTVDADRYNGLTLDVAAGITASIAKNGENVPTANLPMNAKKHTGAANAAIAGEYLVWGQAVTIGKPTVVSAGTWFNIKGASDAASYGEFLKTDNTVLAYFGGGASAGTLVATAADFVVRAVQGKLILSGPLGTPDLVLDTGGNVKVERSLQVGAVDLTTGKLVYNAYTPTNLGGSTNIASATPTVHRYCRIGDMVIVQGACTVDPTATGATAIKLSLPIASDLINTEDLTGGGATLSPGQALVVSADAATNGVFLSVPNISSAASDLWVYIFAYLVR